MSIKIAFSTNLDVDKNVTEIVSGLKSSDPRMIIFFSSVKVDPYILNAKLKSLFPQAVIIGCTTAGEIVSGKMLKGSVVAMGIGDDIIDDISIGIVEEIKEQTGVSQAFSSFEKHFGISMAEMDINSHVGLILADGLSGAEERLMDTIGDLTDITFIGGSAGDDLEFNRTLVFADGQVYTNASVLAIMKLKKGFDIIKTQSFNPTKKILKATKVDELTRTVHEFNNEPAIIAYAKALGIEAGNAAEQFMKHPLGLISIDGQPFVRSPQQVKGNSIVFYCNIKEGMELSILDSTDIIANTKKDIDEKIKSFGPISGMINFNCILRTLELEQKNLTRQYGELFSSIPTIGFSTYGEEYIGHINQTATILVLK